MIISRSILVILIWVVNSHLCFSTSEKAELLYQYELRSHKEFQEKLYRVSLEYFELKSLEFVDEETGFFGIWKEAFKYFESKEKKAGRWKVKIGYYLKNTAYQTLIQNYLDQYLNNLNIQRKDVLGVEKVKESNLIIENLDSVIVSNEFLNEIIAKVQEMVLYEVIPEIIDLILAPLVIFPIISSLILLIIPNFSSVYNYFRIIIMAFLIIYPLYKSIQLSRNMELYLIESFKDTSENNLIVLPALNDNSENFYKNLDVL
ncbi:hypothetical protein Belba_2865 [Belliella baltica DSM 15883]|uniref:Uncharacterized protein n=2 Tax=Belliella TaxID=232244 RepID=I3Z829_BELBD|nr:hypothetical protein Belba_2865 [Belliella baltica DSM 15883]